MNRYLYGTYMALRNTTVSYGSLAKFMHWFMAFLFLAAYCTIYYRHYFTGPCLRGQGLPCSPENIQVFSLHKSFGLTILVFGILRLIWRLSNPGPPPDFTSPFEHLGAKLVHGTLYFCMIAMPITGYVANGGGTDYFGLIDIPSFRRTEIYDILITQGMGIDFRTFEAPLDLFHKQISGALLLWMLILVHVSAALYHHFWQKDQTLVRMLPSRLAKQLFRGSE